MSVSKSVRILSTDRNIIEIRSVSTKEKKRREDVISNNNNNNNNNNTFPPPLSTACPLILNKYEYEFEYKFEFEYVVKISLPFLPLLLSVV